MFRLSTLSARGAAVLMSGSLLVLGGCHHGATKDTRETARTQSQFDLTMKAYKNGQFLIDGAVVSALDAGSHFSYLKETGALPKTVLLLPSEDSKIHAQHLQYMARLELDYGFVVYYENGDKLTRINPVETHARALEDYHAPASAPSGDSGKGAGGGVDSTH